MEEPRNWLNLPSELTADILRRTGAIQILSSAQEVCTSWWKLCKDPAMWRVIDMTNDADFSLSRWKLEKMCKNAVDSSEGQLIDISIGYFGKSELLHYIADRSSQVRRLRISPHFRSLHGELGKVVIKLPLLEELSLNFTDISEEDIKVVGSSCPELKSFNLNTSFKCNSVNGSDSSCDSEAIAIAESMPKLLRLQLIGNKMTDRGLKEILDRCDYLESLDLRLCKNLKFEGSLEQRCSKQIKDLKRPNDSLKGFRFTCGIRDDDYRFYADYHYGYVDSGDDYQNFRTTTIEYIHPFDYYNGLYDSDDLTHNYNHAIWIDHDGDEYINLYHDHDDDLALDHEDDTTLDHADDDDSVLDLDDYPTRHDVFGDDHSIDVDNSDLVLNNDVNPAIHDVVVDDLTQDHAIWDGDHVDNDDLDLYHDHDDDLALDHEDDTTLDHADDDDFVLDDDLTFDDDYPTRHDVFGNDHGIDADDGDLVLNNDVNSTFNDVVDDLTQDHAVWDGADHDDADDLDLYHDHGHDIALDHEGDTTLDHADDDDFVLDDDPTFDDCYPTRHDVFGGDYSIDADDGGLALNNDVNPTIHDVVVDDLTLDADDDDLVQNRDINSTIHDVLADDLTPDSDDNALALDYDVDPTIDDVVADDLTCYANDDDDLALDHNVDPTLRDVAADLIHDANDDNLTLDANHDNLAFDHDYDPTRHDDDLTLDVVLGDLVIDVGNTDNVVEDINDGYGYDNEVDNYIGYDDFNTYEDYNDYGYTGDYGSGNNY